MPTTALYHWRVAGSPVEILVDLALVDRLRIAAAASTDETGGILLGYYDNNYLVINDFEGIDSEHRRGAAYTLSQKDEARLASRLELKRKRGAGIPVGFFRTHLRPGMFLDEGDNHVLSTYFSSPNQVALLIKPAGDRAATGGFFFWEEGEMNRKQSYLPFPLSSRELETGDFPLVEPVAAVGTVSPSSPLSDFEEAETVDMPHAPGATPAKGVSTAAATHVGSATTETPKIARGRNLPWQLIGSVAALAAFGGYLIGTSGSHRDRFGARSGDMTLNSQPPEPQPVAAPPVTPLDRSARPAAMPPVQAPAAAVPAETKPADSPPIAPPPSVKPTAPSAPVQKSKPVPAIPSRVIAENRVARALPPVAQASAPPEDSSATWQHFHPEGPTQPAVVANVAPPHVTEAAPRQAAVPAGPIALSSVSLEAVESGSVGRAFSKIPLFGSLHHSRSGENFTPPQALRSGAPRVPAELARELTGALPVDLKLKVDVSGRVSSVEILSHQSPPEFVRLAGDAAYDWKFEPARVKDKVVSSDVIAHFTFRPSL